MSVCVKLGDKLGKAVGQVGRLYALYTEPTSPAPLFVRRPSTDLPALGIVYARQVYHNPSVKFSCTLFPQDLLMQLSKESY